MPTKDNINLIPSEIIQEQSSAKQKRGLLFFALIILAISIVITAVMWFIALSQNVKITNTTNDIAERKEQLKELEGVEQKGSVLQLKLEYLNKILAGTYLHSKVMKELEERSQTGIKVTSVNLDGSGVLKVSGEASSTPNLQNYVVKLVEEPENLFSDAKILEVAVVQGGVVNFTVSVQVDKNTILFNLPK